jgi:hypothetical protein
VDFTKRQFLAGEEFSQVMNIEVIKSNSNGASTTQLATVNIYNCNGAAI